MINWRTFSFAPLLSVMNGQNVAKNTTQKENTLEQNVNPNFREYMKQLEKMILEPIALEICIFDYDSQQINIYKPHKL